MKVVILAGGFGTRLSEETDIKPKSMVEIGGYPIIRHIMKIYFHFIRLEYDCWSKRNTCGKISCYFQ